jgi:hypothetical protein
MRLLRAGPYCQCVLGLKPQAQSYSPFGTKNSTQPKYLSTFFEATSTADKSGQKSAPVERMTVLDLEEAIVLS